MSTEKPASPSQQRCGRKTGTGTPAKNYTDEFSHSQHLNLETNMQPNAVVHSSYRERFAVPRQPSLDDAQQATIELKTGMNLDQALKDLDGFSHIWVIYWMHLNQGWNPTVTPPRGPKVKRGLFATRAPHRPNSIGLSAVRLTKIEGRILHIKGHDMLDGTPVLDIKPYLPYADAFSDANCGWVDETGVAEMQESINTGS